MNNTQHTPIGLWIDNTNAALWAESLRRELLACLAPLFGKNTEDMAHLQVEVLPPAEADARRAYEKNLDLFGTVEVTLGQDRLQWRVPMPYQGPFLSHRPGSQRGFVSVWTSCLGEAPGIRLIRPTSRTRRMAGELDWRVGLPGGSFLERNFTKTKGKKKPPLQATPYFGRLEAYPSWLRSELAVLGLRGGDCAPKEILAKLHELIQEHSADLGEPVDLEDLSHRILVTYPVWLKHRLVRECRQLFPQVMEKDLRLRVMNVLSGREEGLPDLGQQVWETLASHTAWVEKRLISGVHNARSKDHADLVDPINPVDLAGRITRIKRIALPASRLEEMPPEYRQNHPSFRGCICPVDSPESGQVGLTLQLAVGAQVDMDGKISPAKDPGLELGFGAGLVPFFAHNDGARNMMGAKNLRQAVPLRQAKPAVVMTGGEKRLQEFIGPLQKIGVCPKALDEKSEWALGRDLLVAYMPWQGLNFEDAVVLGQQVVDQGLLDITLTNPTVRQPVPVGWVPKESDEPSVLPWSKDGLALEGSTLFADSMLARLVWEGEEAAPPRYIRFRQRTSAVLKSIRFTRKSPWTGGMLEYEYEAPIPVKPGDKLMGRHGNKGVVSAILPESEMPRLPDHEGIPLSLRGRAVDLILNPHGVISRMNLGQLLETHLGWVMRAGDKSVQEFLQAGTDANVLPAAAFETCLDHKKVRKTMTDTGLDAHGRVQLLLPDGSKTLSPVVVGYQHIVRLKHVPETKSQVRRGGQRAHYASRTGQAVHGRRMGGGQRMGEMEEWALSAHGVEAILAEMLGVKSIMEVAATWKPGDDLPEIGDGMGFPSVLGNWLFALGLGFSKNKEGKRVLGFISDETWAAFRDANGEVTRHGGFELAPAARFRCMEGGKTPCGYTFLDGETIAFPSTAGGKASNKSTLCLGDVLAHLSLRAEGAVELSGSKDILPLVDLLTGEKTQSLQVTFEAIPDKDWLKAIVSPIPAKHPPRWPEELKEIHLYGRFGKGKKQGNWLAPDLAEEFRKKEGRSRSITEMRVTCPDHPSSPLVGVKPFRQKKHGVPGGLFDPMIFGDAFSLRSGEAKARWGWIQLPVPVAYPLDVFGKQAGTPDDQEVPEIQTVPVLPIRYRMPMIRGEIGIEDELDRVGYAPLVRMCAEYKKMEATLASAESPEDQESIEKGMKQKAKQIEGQVATLFGLLQSVFKGKSGLIRRHGLGRRVDRSARLVITPNPKLSWDQAGVPTPVLWELMGDMVESWWHDEQELGLAKTESGEDELVDGNSFWKCPLADPRAQEKAERILVKYLKEYPDTLILLNRQPSLHRDSFQAFHPVPLAGNAGEVLQISPLACKGFAADFDGDEMVIHMPLTKEAQEEAQRLCPSRNLYSLANRSPGNVLAHFDQDLVLGTWWMGALQEQDFKKRFLEILPSDECRSLVPKNGPITKKDGEALLAIIASHHAGQAVQVISEWARLAFEVCTRLGVSFGYYEQLHMMEALQESIKPHLENPTDQANEELSNEAGELLKSRLKKTDKLDLPGLHFAAMACSGARGGKQVRQLIAARGWLQPGAVCFEPNEKDAFIKSSLVRGLDPEEAFRASMNARSSMCDKKLGTGHAGGLSRHLVFALRPQRIVSADCGNGFANEKRSLYTCTETQGFCAKCYGVLPDGRLPSVGFQAGLIAAQSIGERGTQLSMQSFHAGKREIDIFEVRKLLGVRGKADGFHFVEPSEAELFVSHFQESSAYKDLEPRHFYLLWAVLHRTVIVCLTGLRNDSGMGSPESIATEESLIEFWNTMTDKEKKKIHGSLSDTVALGDPLTRMGYRDPVTLLREAVSDGLEFPETSPLEKLIL